MKQVLLVLGFLLLLQNLSCPSFCYAELQERKTYRVSKVIDGDTFKLESGEKIRLIGIDAPEIRINTKLKKDVRGRHRSQKEELVAGRKSFQFTKRLIEGKKVRLEFDKLKYDEYQRVLAYVYLANGVFVNAKIVKEGYAYSFPIKPDLRYAQVFAQMHKEAQENRRGLWKKTKRSPKGFQWFHEN